MISINCFEIRADIFEYEEILLIEQMPDSDALLVIWLKLLCLACKQNNNGIVALPDNMPDNTQMELALQTFSRFDMINVVNNTIAIVNWNKYHSADGINRIRIPQQKQD